MIYPSADKIEKEIDSRYALVILAAKRARQIKEGSKPLHKPESANPLTAALEEIAQGEIKYRFDENSLAGKEALEDQKLVAGRRDIEVDIDPLATPSDPLSRAATALGANLEDFLGDEDEELEEVLVEKDEADDEDDTPSPFDDEEERAEV